MTKPNAFICAIRGTSTLKLGESCHGIAWVLPERHMCTHLSLAMGEGCDPANPFRVPPSGPGTPAFRPRMIPALLTLGGGTAGASLMKTRTLMPFCDRPETLVTDFPGLSKADTHEHFSNVRRGER